MKTVSIPEATGGWADLFDKLKGSGPRWWVAEHDGVRIVNLQCGGTCQRHAGALDDHTVEADGRVHASILCPGCGWHVMGVLDGWRFGRKAPGQPVATCSPD